MTDPAEHLARLARETDEYLQRRVADLCADAPPTIVEAVNYSLFAGGKRLRPALVLMWFEVGGAADRTPALATAGAIELVHTFSLVHDDLPAMDDDDLRRGKPTSHKVFGEAVAILAGDALTTLAFELLAEDGGQLAPRLVAELARASGPRGMIGGQVLDMGAVGRAISVDELRGLHGRKTGALMTCACRMGALTGGADVEAATRYGEAIGLAFQIVDDLLDATGDAARLGKAAGKDAGRGKNTYPGLLGVEASRTLARGQVAAAHAALAGVAAGDALRAMANLIVARDR